MKFILKPGHLSLADMQLLMDEKVTLELDPTAIPNIKASQEVIHHIIENNQTVYGINTGFGALAGTRISNEELADLQYKIVVSHAAGTCELLSDQNVRLILLLKINSLARGYSGVRLDTILALIKLFNHGIYPCVPGKGSVGASGDLAPLAHLSLTLLGIGEARYQGKKISALEALTIAGLKPLTLAPKEGLALLNGTQVSTALALSALFDTQVLFVSAIITGALSLEAAKGSHDPFDARIQEVRGHQSQIKVASAFRSILEKSEIRESHRDCAKVQDPYSLRCQPQVMGACLMQFEYVAQVLLTEANAVSDNPLVFHEDQTILSGGNFHAEPVAFAADALALVIAEIGALAERRIALLVDPHFSGMPAFLVKNPGVNSGFMIAQVTAAALASENKSLAHPGSVDSIPTSANQEDHVSMATFAALRLHTMIDNTRGIIAIELLAACQGLDFNRPLQSSAFLETIHQLVREQIPYYAEDRYFAPDIAAAKALITEKTLYQLFNFPLFN